MGMAKAHPDINYIGIEMYSSVLYRAVQKLELEPLDNLKFILLDAKDIAEVFDKEDGIKRIYINFILLLTPALLEKLKKNSKH